MLHFVTKEVMELEALHEPFFFAVRMMHVVDKFNFIILHVFVVGSNAAVYGDRAPIRHWHVHPHRGLLQVLCLEKHGKARVEYVDDEPATRSQVRDDGTQARFLLLRFDKYLK